MRIVWLAASVAALIGGVLPLWHYYLAPSQSRQSQETDRSEFSDKRTGSLFLSLGLLLLAVLCGITALSSSTGSTTKQKAIPPLYALLIAASPVLLATGLIYAARARTAKHKLTLLLDSLIIGGAITALLWWLLIERSGHGATKLPFFALPIATVALTTAFGITLFGYPLSSGERRPAVATAFMLTGVFCMAAGFTIWWFTGSPTLPVAVACILGIAAIGAGAFLDNHPRFGNDIDMTRLRNVPVFQSSTFEVPLTLLLPCLALLVGLAHLSSVHRNLASVPRGELWWGPLLLVAAVFRTLWDRLGEDLPGHESGHSLSHENLSLREQLKRRTNQLSTLHAITADLNNTLDSEQLLSGALDRMRQSVEADAAAVWLLLSDTPLASEGDPTVSHASALLREIERGATERRAVENIKRGHHNTSYGVAAYDYSAHGVTRDSSDNDGLGAQQHGHAATTHGLRWKTVQTIGDVAQGGIVIESMRGQLELGDLDACTAFCKSNSNGFAHVAPIRWKEEIIGAIGITRRQGNWDEAELALLDALAMELGVALQNAQLYQEASRLADRDSLTDLLNHRALQQQLNAVLSRARRIPTEFSVVMMDVKNFQFFNDTYGHPIGDRVLRTVAQCLRDACRTSDILGRFGGDEFTAILLDTDSKGTLEVCARIAKRVEQESFQVMGDGRRIPIGLSFGASLYPQDGDNSIELLGTSNTNLAESKTSGTPFVLTDKAQQSQEIRQLKDVSVGGSFGVLDALVTAIDNKDHYTRRHSEDVSQWATLMSGQLGHSEEMQRAVRICGLLHDVGKIAVPDSILRKPGRLNDDEFQIMQQHPVFGALIVKDVPNLSDVLGGIRHHHERFDGKGYPDKLRGDNIPLMGRMLAVPDCFSAMTTERPYRKALSWSEAISEIEKGRGTQFDPVTADAFLEVIARMVAEKSAEGDALPGVEGYENGEAVLRPRSVTDAEAVPT